MALWWMASTMAWPRADQFPVWNPVHSWWHIASRVSCAKSPGRMGNRKPHRVQPASGVSTSAVGVHSGMSPIVQQPGQSISGPPALAGASSRAWPSRCWPGPLPAGCSWRGGLEVTGRLRARRSCPALRGCGDAGHVLGRCGVDDADGADDEVAVG